MSRGAFLVGGTALIVVAAAIAWPRDRVAPGVPELPSEVSVDPPWHLLGPRLDRAGELTKPPVPVNPGEVRQALAERYPAALREAGVEGTVTVWLEIDETGRVVEAELGESSGFRGFDTVALSVARLARFEPAYEGDDPVAVRLEYEVPFGGDSGPEPPSDIGLHSRTVQLVAVYLGATACLPCRDEKTKQAVREVLETAAARARERNLEFQSVGAALDEDVQAGLELLASTAPFDQVVVGGSWSNTAAVELIWSDPDVLAAIPHVVLLTRTIDRSPQQREPATKHIFVQLQGEPQMREWLDAGGTVF